MMRRCVLAIVNISGAVANVHAMLHASKAAGDQHILITTLHCVSVERLAVMVLERTLGLGEATDQELQELQNMLLEQSRIPYFLIGLRGERAGIDMLFESIQTGDLSVDEFSTLPAMKKLPGPLATLWRFYTKTTIKDRRAEMLNLMTDAVEIARAHARDPSGRTQGLGKEIPRVGHSQHHAVLPGSRAYQAR